MICLVGMHVCLGDEPAAAFGALTCPNQMFHDFRVKHQIIDNMLSRNESSISMIMKDWSGGRVSKLFLSYIFSLAPQKFKENQWFACCQD